MNRFIHFCLTQRLVVAIGALLLLGWGLASAPFDWNLPIPRDPVPVDAIPDLGENQQIVFTAWEGRSPQDVEDQVTYPLTISLLGVPGVRTIRSYSYFGFSSIYLIFEEQIEFYWSRSRILERLSSLPPGLLPEDVLPRLGPDATGLGQIFQYTLEGRDSQGRPVGGWDLHELRSIQDYTVRYALMAVEGVAEVASIGGYVREYQIDVNPDSMRSARVSLEQIIGAVRDSNIDVGARTIEFNRSEFVIRGLGFIESLDDIRQTVVAERGNVPIRVQDVATVALGPAMRRGILDKGGGEAVGGIVTVRYRSNPLQAINRLRQAVGELSLPRKTLADGTVSQVTVVPFYDRTQLIHETLATLETALSDEILITLIVVVAMLGHLAGGLLISALLPAAVLLTFVGMRLLGVDANIVALSGIAIAIGTMVDMGIVLSENIFRRLREAGPEARPLETVFKGAAEVGSAILTAVATTLVSFLPVFALTAAEGKLFRPLAYTKTLALVAALLLTLAIIPTAALSLFVRRRPNGAARSVHHRISARLGSIGVGHLLWILAGVALTLTAAWWLGTIVAGVGVFRILEARHPQRYAAYSPYVIVAAVLLSAAIALSRHWMPLGPAGGFLLNLLFVASAVGGLLGVFKVFQRAYPRLLQWCLVNKRSFLAVPGSLAGLGLLVWMGYGSLFFFVPKSVREFGPLVVFERLFPGLGREFMPDLDEGAFLYMPTTMPHASIGEGIDVLQKLDMAVASVPEVALAVGKLGRAETALDPAPISMIETVVNYKPEYDRDRNGNPVKYRYDWQNREFIRDTRGRLIPDSGGRPHRNWRSHIRSPDDIWEEIVSTARLPGTTSAPKLQPIAARLVMLQSGMRAPMGVKIRGSDLESIEAVSLDIERILKGVPSVSAPAVIADRIVGKPYLEIAVDRSAIARHGISMRQVQQVIEVAVGGRQVTATVEGRERYPVRIRYLRELRDRVETLGSILVASVDGAQVPLQELAEIRYVRGPQSIKSEDAKLTAYVLFDKRQGHSDIEVVEEAQERLAAESALFQDAYDELSARLGRAPTPDEAAALPGLNLRGCERPVFAGSYQNQIRSRRTLMVVIPVALAIILLILHLQFRSLSTSLIVFSGVAVAASGGFLILWLYSFPGFLDFDLLGYNLRELMGIRLINLSVAVWVGFIALFGIAVDDGVVMATYLTQSFRKRLPESVEEIRAATLEAGRRRVRPCLMTTATTLLALLPVLTSQGRGSEIMVPMAVPVFGGMALALLTMFVVPTLYCGLRERELAKGRLSEAPTEEAPSL